MNKNCLILLFLALALIPLTSLLVRPSMIGVDSYAYINAICQKQPFPENTEFLSKAIMQALPCDFLFLKVFTWALYLALIAIIALLGHHFFGKTGLIAPLFAFFSLYWLVLGWELENDLLATPLLWFSILLMVKNKKIEALLLILFTGYFIWGGAWIFLIILGLSFSPALIAAIIVLSIKFKNIIGTLLPNFITAENLLFGGIINLLVLNIGWQGFRINKKLHPLLLQALFFIPIAILSGKYAYHAIPFLCLGVVGLFEKATTQWKIGIIAAGFTMLLIISSGLLTTFPKQGTLESVEFAIKSAKDENKQLLNDWDLGYYVEFYNYDTNYKGGIPNPDYNKAKNAIIVSQLDLNFEKIKNFGNYTVYRS